MTDPTRTRRPARHPLDGPAALLPLAGWLAGLTLVLFALAYRMVPTRDASPATNSP